MAIHERRRSGNWPYYLVIALGIVGLVLYILGYE